MFMFNVTNQEGIFNVRLTKTNGVVESWDFSTWQDAFAEAAERLDTEDPDNRFNKKVGIYINNVLQMILTHDRMSITYEKT